MFCELDTASGFHKVEVDKEASKFLIIVTNMGRLSFTVMPQCVCNRSALWNILTNGDSRTDFDLNIIKNMDDFLLYRCESELQVETQQVF